MSLNLFCSCGKRITNPFKEKRIKSIRKGEKVLLKCPSGHDNYVTKNGNGKLRIVT